MPNEGSRMTGISFSLRTWPALKMAGPPLTLHLTLGKAAKSSARCKTASGLSHSARRGIFPSTTALKTLAVSLIVVLDQYILEAFSPRPDDGPEPGNPGGRGRNRQQCKPVFKGQRIIRIFRVDRKKDGIVGQVFAWRLSRTEKRLPGSCGAYKDSQVGIRRDDARHDKLVGELPDLC